MMAHTLWCGCVGWSYCVFFFFQAEDGIRDVAVTGVQTCALPISHPARPTSMATTTSPRRDRAGPAGRSGRAQHRSEEHTSELQSRLHLVCRLLLEKKKKKQINQRRQLLVTRSAMTPCTLPHPHII